MSTGDFKHIEGTGKPLKVVAPNKTYVPDYIKKNTEYLCEVVGDYCDGKGWWFYIILEDGRKIGTNEIESAHFNGGNWIVTQRET